MDAKTNFKYPPGFKVRDKATAAEFVEHAAYGTGTLFWTDDKMDYCLECISGVCRVAERRHRDRGTFDAYQQVIDPVNTVYRTRKYINEKFFKEG